jgi:putative FmdB family regulatory protein
VNGKRNEQREGVMPTYDYECLKCGKITEAFQKITAPPLKNCPYCQGKLKRLIGTGSGLIFKGSGFYITDYKKKNFSQTPPKKETHSAASPSCDKKCEKGKK